MSASQQARNKELHEQINHLEAKLKSVTVRHLASMLNMRRTIEQLEDEVARAKFRLTDPARVERATEYVNRYGWKQWLSTEENVRAILAAANGWEGVRDVESGR